MSTTNGTPVQGKPAHDSYILTRKDWRGREIIRKVKLGLNIRDFKGRAGMPWLIMAANTHLSINDLLEVMAAYGCERTRSWVSRRRWIFFDANYVRKVSGRNADGQEARAYQVMAEYPHVSARKLARILQDAGIKRGRDWVLRNRAP